MAAQKQLEKSKISTKSTKNSHSPTNSLGISHGGRNERAISPSNSTLSNGSAGSSDHPKASRPTKYTSSASPSPPPPPSSISRKTRVPGLNKKKSAMGLSSKRKVPNFFTLLNSEDFSMRIDGIHQVAKKLGLMYPYTPIPDLEHIQLETTSQPVDGDKLKAIILQQFEDVNNNFVYETLSSWECVTCVMLRLLSFEEYIPRLILDVDEPKRVDRQKHARIALQRAKLFLQHENPDLANILFTSLVHFGGFGGTTPSNGKRDIYKLPANRRKLAKEFLVWMNELLTPLIGLDKTMCDKEALEGVPDAYLQVSSSSTWFESDANLRQCMDILLPLVITHSSGSAWHAPLVTFMKHVRLLNQSLFDSIVVTYDDSSINKICRVLGVHVRLDLAAVQQQSSDNVSIPLSEQSIKEEEEGEEDCEEEQEEEEKKEEEEEEEISAKQIMNGEEVLDDQVVNGEEEKTLVEQVAVNEEEKYEEPREKAVINEKEERCAKEQHTTEDEHEKEELSEINKTDTILIKEEEINQKLIEVMREDKQAVKDETSINAYSLSDEQRTPELRVSNEEPNVPDLTEVMYDKHLEDEQIQMKSPIPKYYQHHANMVPPLASNFPDSQIIGNPYYDQSPILVIPFIFSLFLEQNRLTFIIVSIQAIRRLNVQHLLLKQARLLFHNSNNNLFQQVSPTSKNTPSLHMSHFSIPKRSITHALFFNPTQDPMHLVLCVVAKTRRYYSMH